MNLLRSLSTLAVAAALLVVPFVADAAMGIDGKPKVTFYATGSPGFMSIEGISNQMTLKDTDGQLEFTVPMTTVSSGISLRDEHMNNNYVQVDQFPNAVLTFARSDVKWPDATTKSVDGSVQASFTIHGITQPVTVTYTTSGKPGAFKVKARFDYDVSKHGITIEPYMGISFDHKMYATVNVDLFDAP